jgi:iron complex outermembrane receptor protein
LRGRQVLVLIDGIPQSTPLRNGARDLRVIDPSAIERVEVIKGASAIYGNGADGGIINYITKRNKTDKNIPESHRLVLQASLMVEP